MGEILRMRCRFYLVILLWIRDASINCDGAWVHNDDNNHVYYFSYDNNNPLRTWPEARDECEDMGAYLVTINNRAENEFLHDSYNLNRDHWIGLRCGSGTCNGDNGLTWVNGNSDYRDFATTALFADIRYVYIYFGDEDWYGSDSRVDEKRYICEKPDGCHNPDNPCQNGGTCSPDNRDGYTCACDAGFTGRMCQISLHCASGPCNHGSCSEGTESYICDCGGTGYTGSECDDDIDECSDNSHNCIANNGRCNNTIASFTCVCNAGWTGPRCQANIDECRSNPCQHGGSCGDDVNGYSCTCTVGYMGSHCESDADECREYTGICNNGTCNNTEGAFTCMCYHGYKGDLCDRDVNECTGSGNICQHQGTCVNTIGSYQCRCVPGYMGQNCEQEMDECKSSPCMNGAICTDMFNGFTCSCSSNFQGRNCAADVNECLHVNTCGEGNCTNTYGGFTCQCPRGFEGVLCSTDIDECLDEKACHGHGQCDNTYGDFTCSCKIDFYGERCEIDLNELTEGKEVTRGIAKFSNNLPAIGFMSASLILLLFLVAALIFIIITKQQWIPRFRKKKSESSKQCKCNIQRRTDAKEATDPQDITLELESHTYENARSLSAPQNVNLEEIALDTSPYEHLGPMSFDEQPYELDTPAVYASLRMSHLKGTT